MAQQNMIEAVGLTKAYGETQALAGVDLAVPAGTILGVLGPNGAGKTTAVRILTTLATPDGGRATVAGYDIATQANLVRRHIGVAAQDATLDGALTGRQNLALIGELSRMGRSASRARAAEWPWCAFACALVALSVAPCTWSIVPWTRTMRRSSRTS